MKEICEYGSIQVHAIELHEHHIKQNYESPKMEEFKMTSKDVMKMSVSFDDPDIFGEAEKF